MNVDNFPTKDGKRISRSNIKIDHNQKDPFKDIEKRIEDCDT